MDSDSIYMMEPFFVDGTLDYPSSTPSTGDGTGILSGLFGGIGNALSTAAGIVANGQLQRLQQSFDDQPPPQATPPPQAGFQITPKVIALGAAGVVGAVLLFKIVK